LWEISPCDRVGEKGKAGQVPFRKSESNPWTKGDVPGEKEDRMGGIRMPIYEYECLDPEKGCSRCTRRFEMLQRHDDAPLSACPDCGQRVRKLVSWCRAAVVESAEQYVRSERRISEYEKQGMWSHAAELADKQSEKLKDPDLKTRALEDYRKAGYDFSDSKIESS